MKTTLTTSQAAHILIDDENANWSRAGAYALIEYLEALEESMAEDLDFDHVAIRCDWSEYADLMEWGKYHFADMMDAISKLSLTLNDEGRVAESDDEVDDRIRDFIRDNGELIEFDGGIIVSSF